MSFSTRPKQLRFSRITGNEYRVFRVIKSMKSQDGTNEKDRDSHSATPEREKAAPEKKEKDEGRDTPDEEDSAYGGLPSRNLKKNLGCGG